MQKSNQSNKSTSTQSEIEELLRYLDINANDLNGERALWQSVIMQAVLDATSNTKDLKSRIERAKTISWFSLNNEDFMLVCSFSELNPNFIIKGLKKVLARNKKPYINRYRKKHALLKKATSTKSLPHPLMKLNNA